MFKNLTKNTFFKRDSKIHAVARLSRRNSVCLFVCLSVRLSVCHTGESVKNDAR